MGKKEDAEDAHRQRLSVAENMLRLFEEAHGRPASTVEEAVNWLSSPEGKAALAYYLQPDGTIAPE
jgi:hypothetical protein